MENNRVINPNEYGSLLFDEKEETAVNNVMKAKRIFRYSKTLQPYTEKFEKPISKSGINHRIRKIKQIASEIKGD